MSMLEHCCDLGIQYITVYAFSIDNFNKKQDEVESFMDLMLEKTEEMLKEDSIIYKYNIKVKFIGNLNLLNKLVRIVVDRVMAATSGNTKRIFSICVAYTCTDEIVHAVQESCQEKWAKIQQENLEGVDSEVSIITVTDLERHMYMAGCPDPDILIRTSGETRLSNFLLWQTTFCYLFTPNALWPEISLKHLVWEILKYQCVRPYLEKKKNDGEFSK
ncbi:dehydrodolichyl diphosphate synthase CPT3-like [Magnolia sinica]|uniref:dehydrodolichyl diphosphate synthase CPT3-like n=1 Tax=Magnolia sinica TaxID=86752 RepID=UPI0026597E8B|nr:dehydrodolichyl diphosphate synthase CPT3-like [Magnolia sinica]